ncbi:alpha/beta hydrolase [Bacillus sp. 31A1R]|uniref:Alpha/beta hydrolase n=1 Tax=Robertmurraya mangrovi TaxID=3098077 RepID=A0ABU5IWD5_9BACI|nr:alpha/beta hydrolase [Bacillus sp. 31A1R]MDZ5471446.1 alpha/beta hydrolase [Bacillus sp. 31A1R]
MFKRKTKQIVSNFVSVASLEERVIGGFNQTLLIRGENCSNPIMLFLHGGPGTAQIGFAPKFQKVLEKDFIVVNWDQRGAGLSYSKGLKSEDLTIACLVNDTVEVIEYLLNRFKQKKLFLVGHSWGSLLGTLVTQKVPEYIHSYIGIGQVVSMQDGEKISYEYTLEKAKNLNNRRALKELGKYKFDPSDMNYLDTQRKWLEKFGGSFIGVSTWDLIYSNMLFATEYTFKDWSKYMKAGKQSLLALWPQMIEFNAINTIPKLDVPVYIMAGKHDYQTPFQLAEKYFHILECPYKELIWFENSGHLPNYEETDKFNKECLKIKIKHVG